MNKRNTSGKVKAPKNKRMVSRLGLPASCNIKSARENFNCAERHFRNGRYRQALEHVDMAISKGCETAEVLEVLVLKSKILFSLRGHDKEALRLMERVRKRSSSLLVGDEYGGKTKKYRSLYSQSLYWLGLWTYFTEDEPKSVAYLTEYVQLSSSFPCLKLPAQYARRILRAAEAALIDPDCRRVNALVCMGCFGKALEIVETMICHAGIDMIDHWPLALGAKACHAMGRHHKAMAFSSRALRRNSRCPKTGLIYGIVHISGKSNKVVDEGYSVLCSLARKKIETIAYGPCGNGMEDAHYISLSSKYGIALMYGKLGDVATAKRLVLQCLRSYARNKVDDVSLIDKVTDLKNAIENDVPDIKSFCQERLNRFFG